METAFIKACDKGIFTDIQNIYNICKPDIHANNDLAFRYACQNGHLEVTK